VKERLEIANTDLRAYEHDPDWNVNIVSDWYLIKLLKFANEAGLKGRKIKKVIGIQENFATQRKYIDFICEEST
jgi:hypothetical protein